MAWTTLELIISKGCVEDCFVCPQPTYDLEKKQDVVG